MTFKSNLVKFTALIILISLFGAACSQATPEEIRDIVIGPEAVSYTHLTLPTTPYV